MKFLKNFLCRKGKNTMDTDFANILLKMIEEVDITNTEELDEIDAIAEKCFGVVTKGGLKKYTRSRDLLKDIRPEGYDITISTIASPDGTYFSTCDIGESGTFNFITTPDLPSEELAELYAIVTVMQEEFEKGSL